MLSECESDAKVFDFSEDYNTVDLCLDKYLPRIHFRVSVSSDYLSPPNSFIETTRRQRSKTINQGKVAISSAVNESEDNFDGVTTDDDEEEEE